MAVWGPARTINVIPITLLIYKEPYIHDVKSPQWRGFLAELRLLLKSSTENVTFSLALCSVSLSLPDFTQCTNWTSVNVFSFRLLHAFSHRLNHTLLFSHLIRLMGTFSFQTRESNYLYDLWTLTKRAGPFTLLTRLAEVPIWVYPAHYMDEAYQ